MSHSALCGLIYGIDGVCLLFLGWFWGAKGLLFMGLMGLMVSDCCFWADFGVLRACYLQRKQEAEGGTARE